MQNGKQQPRGSNLLGVRQYNERLLLQVIRRAGSLSRAQLARVTGLSAQTVSVISNRLMNNGLLQTQAPEPSQGRIGQPAIPIALNPEGAYSVGIKIGRSSLDIMLVNFVGEVLQHLNHPHAYPHPEQTFERIDRELDALIRNLPKARAERIVGIGVAAPDALAGWQTVTGAPNNWVESWNRIDIRERVGRNQALPVWVSNDATAACLAELEFGGQNLWDDFLYIFVGTFIGAGVVQNGILNAGSQHNAGALGSMPVPARYAGEAAERDVDSVQLINCASRYLLNNRLVAAGYEPNAAVAQLGREGAAGAPAEVSRLFDEWLQHTARAIAVAITAAVSVIDFKGVVIDGLLPASQVERLVLALEQALDDSNTEGLLRPQLKPGCFGNDARAIGGAVLPFYHHFTPDMSVLLKVGAPSP